MSVIAEFTIGSPELVLAATLEAVPEMTVELEQQMDSTAYTPLFIVWVAGDGFDAFEDALDADRSVDSYAVVEDLGARRLYRLHVARGNVLPVYPIYQKLGAVPLAGYGFDGGWWRRIRFPNRDSLVRFQEFCSDENVVFTLERLYTPTDDGRTDRFRLTGAQREALVAAHEAGYFRVPRNATLDDLSSALGISKQSVSERLRRAQERLVEGAILSPDRRPHEPPYL